MRLDFGIHEGYKRRAFFTFAWSVVAMLLIGLVADISRSPFIFPSLGPSAIMLLAHPLRKDSSPRHTVIGHLIGAASGYFALWVTGLLGVGFSTQIDAQRVLAGAIAIGLTAGITILLKSEHAPAGATTLIVSLGILPRLSDFLYLMAAVVMLVILVFIINRAFSIRYPIWNPRDN